MTLHERCGRYRRFSDSKVFNSDNFFKIFKKIFYTLIKVVSRINENISFFWSGVCNTRSCNGSFSIVLAPFLPVVSNYHYMRVSLSLSWCSGQHSLLDRYVVYPIPRDIYVIFQSKVSIFTLFSILFTQQLIFSYQKFWWNLSKFWSNLSKFW